MRFRPVWPSRAWDTLGAPVATDSGPERRRRVTHRAVPALGAIAVAAFAGGLAIGRATESGSQQVARKFARAWQRGDLAAMRELTSAESRRRYSAAQFAAAYADARATATITRLVIAPDRGERDGRVRIPVRVQTRIFGTLRAELALPVADHAVSWTPALAFPGLPEGTRLTRVSRAPLRARIVSADGKTLAAGPAGARTYPSPVGSSIAGDLGRPADAAARSELYARGFPSDTPVGRSGLERALEKRLAGRPGGDLRAGARMIASSRPRAAAPVRTTIDSRVQAAAVTALAGRLGGVAAMDARTGALRALAGIAYSAPQPPGSTFKIVTTTAALEAGAVKLGDRFPVQSKAVIDGVDLTNANNELCGGTFAESFAESCNSVFAPLGVKLGSKRLVDAARRYGFNRPPGIPGALASTLPDAGGIVTPLEIGATAIGQFKTLATPLEMASVAQTVAARGVRIAPRLVPSARRRRERVTTARVAATLARLMLGVVSGGTGTAAQIPGVKVAGKTGTAELENAKPAGDQQTASDPSNTDAWFTSYAPADDPRIAVAVLLVRAGAGGATAAPAAKIVLEAALRR